MAKSSTTIGRRTITGKFFCQGGSGHKDATDVAYLGETKHGGILFVCGKCGRPYYLVWERYVSRCKNCKDYFSGPFEDICVRCYREFIKGDGTTYRGWAFVEKNRRWTLEEHEKHAKKKAAA